MQKRHAVLIFSGVVLVLLLVALLAPVANDPIGVVSPLVFQSPMTTLEPRAYMPLIMCDDCPR